MQGQIAKGEHIQAELKTHTVISFIIGELDQCYYLLDLFVGFVLTEIVILNRITTKHLSLRIYSNIYAVFIFKTRKAVSQITTLITTEKSLTWYNFWFR